MATTNGSTTDVDVAAVASLLGDRTRAMFLQALTEADRLPLSALARRAEVGAATASAQASKLVAAGLVRERRVGRHRYLYLASPLVAEALEALSRIAPPQPVRSLRDASVGAALAAARTCYDHLAGRVGVDLTAALVTDGALTEVGDTFAVTTQGRARFHDLGIDVETLERQRRPLARSCLDWSERRPHLAGGLGSALREELMRRRWLTRIGTGRALRVTTAGRDGLEREFGVAS
jgi:DNA-binding transcriptional ArsR family regulator